MKAGVGVIVSHMFEEFTCRYGFMMSLICAISFLIAPNLLLLKKAQGPGLLFICPYWLYLTHLVGIWWGILRDKQQSLLFEDQTSDSSSSPSYSYKKGLPHRFEYKRLCSCFTGRLQASQLWPVKGERWNLNLLTPLWGTTFTSHLIAAAFPKARQLVGGSEKVTTCLPPGGGQRVTVLRRMTGEKKNKNSNFQNYWACCYGDEPSPLFICSP